MASRRRIQRRQPRMSGPASSVVVRSLETNEVLGTFTPKPTKKRLGVGVDAKHPEKLIVTLKEKGF